MFVDNPKTAPVFLLAAMAATVLAYWVGLGGPFILDDAPNLEVIRNWLAGDATWQQVVFSNRAGVLGRPVSMALLALTGTWGGYQPFAFKLGNLATHIACGFVAWRVFRRLLPLDPYLKRHAELLAVALVAAWLLHPLNVSTVLYPVQRMAQMSTLFALSCVWAYLVGRSQLGDGHRRTGLAILFFAFPMLLLAGVLSKENAVIAPALCLVIDLAYYPGKRPRPLKWFFAVFLVVPAVAVALALALHPERLFAGYALRDFTMGQRLLTETRVLVDYVASILLPRTPMMGVYTDDFTASTSLLSPVSTLYSCVLLAAVSSGAALARKSAPGVFVGWFFFLVAHSVESSIYPLELYFEHRNYLPMFGLLLAATSVVVIVGRLLASPTFRPGRVGVLMTAGILVVLLIGTHGRSRAWSHDDTMVAVSLKTHPESLRANLDSIAAALNRGLTTDAYDGVQRLIESHDQRNRGIGYITRITLDCLTGRGASPTDLRRGVALMPRTLTLAEMYTFDYLRTYMEQGKCGAVTPRQVASGIAHIVDSAALQPDTLEPKWRLRYISAQLFVMQGDWDEALAQAKLAWQPTAAAAVGGLLARAYAHDGNLEAAESTYAQAIARMDNFNKNEVLGLRELRAFLDAKAGKGRTTP